MILKIDCDTVLLQKVTYTSFYDVIKMTLPKMRHLNDVTFFLFSNPSLSKILIVLLYTSDISG